MGKVRSRSTVTPLIRFVLLTLLQKVRPLDVDSVDAFSNQLCHIKTAWFVGYIAARRSSSEPNFQLSVHFMDSGKSGRANYQKHFELIH